MQVGQMKAENPRIWKQCCPIDSPPEYFEWFHVTLNSVTDEVFVRAEVPVAGLRKSVSQFPTFSF